MEISGNAKPPLRDHAIAVAKATVARAAEDIKAIAAAMEKRSVNRYRDRVEELAVRFASVRGIVIV
jgi:hypothetical protein